MISGNIQADPLFLDPQQGDFQIAPVSRAVDAGVDVGLSEDYAGTLVPQNTLPDIGAFESPESTNAVPAVSEGGLLVMSLLLVTAAGFVLARRKQSLQADRPE